MALSKSPDPLIGRRHIYTLTEKGIGLLPVILELHLWMTTYDSKTAARSEYMKSFVQRRTTMIAAHTNRLRKAHLK